MAIVEEGSGEAPIIEDNMYTLTVVSAVTGIREGPDKFNPEVVDAPIVHINTALEGTEDDEGNPIVLRSTMNLKFSRGGTYQPSTLFLFAQAFGVVPDVGTPFDTDWLKGKKARGMVRTETEGKWPKVIPESLIPMPKGAAKGFGPPPPRNESAPPASQEARQASPAAAAVPSIINPDGSVNFDTFWKTLRAENISRTEVVAQVNGDIENLMAMEAADVALLLESLLSVPF